MRKNKKEYVHEKQSNEENCLVSLEEGMILFSQGKEKGKKFVFLPWRKLLTLEWMRKRKQYFPSCCGKGKKSPPPPP
jgi:hypothetical protein